VAWLYANRIHIHLLGFFLISILAVMTTAFSLEKPRHQLKRTQLKFPNKTINVEIADTEHSRAQGLMHREKLNENEGMLFVFKHPTSACFWMKNTLIPLSLAFINDDKVTSIHHMEPHSEKLHCPKKPATYALEVNQGWFKQNHISEGTLIKGLPNIQAK